MGSARFRYEWAAPELRADVFTYWEVEIDGTEPLTDVMMPAWPTIRIVIDGDWAIGPDVNALPPVPPVGLHGLTHKGAWVRGGPGRAFNIVLNPRGWYHHIRANAAEHESRLVPLADVIGGAGDALAQAILTASDFAGRVAAADAFLIERQQRPANAELANKVMVLTMALANPDCGTVGALAAMVGLPETVVARMMLRHFGCSPKKLIRRQRFLRMLYTMEARPYGEWNDFIDPQYTDQSHLIRDFQFYLGLSPGQYFKGDRPMLKPAADAIREKLFGAQNAIPPLADHFLADKEAD